MESLLLKSISILLNPWVLFGLFGQFIFFLRFIVQWWASEKKKAVTIPMAFWYLSVLGTIIILIYSIHIDDVVFTLAQILSFFIYGRNIYIQVNQDKRAKGEAVMKKESEEAKVANANNTDVSAN